MTVVDLLTEFAQNATVCREIAMDERSARVWEKAAAMVGRALTDEADELLSPSQAAADPTIALNHPDSIGRLIRTGKVLNHGSSKRPKVRRGDLEHRPRTKIQAMRLSLTEQASPSLDSFTTSVIASSTRGG